MTEAASMPFIVGMIWLPLSAAVLTFLLPRFSTRIGLATASLMWVGLAGMVWQVSQSGEQVYPIGGWGAPLGIMLSADGLSVFMLLMTTLIGSAVSLYAPGYFSTNGKSGEGAKTEGLDSPVPHFWTLVMFLWAALNALFLSRDIFNLYVTLELLGLAAAAMVALAGSPVALGAAMRYLLVSLLGSLVFLMGVALLYAQYATLDMTLLQEALTEGPVAWTALALMTSGMLIKTALFPLHFWLPAAHANAPAPVSALLSALVVKASLYLLLRLWFGVFAGIATTAALQFLGVLGAAAILWGAYQALRQTRLKLLVAYSTVAQLGYIFLLFPLTESDAGGFTAWGGALYFALSHACAKTVMFFSAGNLRRAAGHDRIADLAGVARALPLSMFAFALAAVSIVGLPPSGGFIGKWMLLNAAISSGQWWWVIVIAVGTLIAAGYVMRVLSLPFAVATPEPPHRAVPAMMEWTALGLGVVCIMLGFLAPYFLELLRLSAPFTGPVLSGGTP